MLVRCLFPFANSLLNLRTVLLFALCSLSVRSLASMIFCRPCLPCKRSICLHCTHSIRLHCTHLPTGTHVQGEGLAFPMCRAITFVPTKVQLAAPIFGRSERRVHPSRSRCAAHPSDGVIAHYNHCMVVGSPKVFSRLHHGFAWCR